MKRQARPFVVEIKKRPKGIAPKRSLWAGTDLAAATQAARSLELADADNAQAVQDVLETEPRTTNEHVSPRPDVNVASDRVDGAQSSAMVVVDDDVVPAVAEATNLPSPGKRRRRRSRIVAAGLPRGQRWKRRLPAVLLRWVKRGD